MSSRPLQPPFATTHIPATIQLRNMPRTPTALVASTARRRFSTNMASFHRYPPPPATSIAGIAHYPPSCTVIGPPSPMNRALNTIIVATVLHRLPAVRLPPTTSLASFEYLCRDLELESHSLPLDIILRPFLLEGIPSAPRLVLCTPLPPPRNLIPR